MESTVDGGSTVSMRDNITWSGNSSVPTEFEQAPKLLVAALILIGSWTIIVNTTLVVNVLASRDSITNYVNLQILTMSATDALVGMSAIPLTLSFFVTHSFRYYSSCVMVFTSVIVPLTAVLFHLFGLCIHRMLVAHRDSLAPPPRIHHMKLAAHIVIPWILAAVLALVLFHVYGVYGINDGLLSYCSLNTLFGSRYKSAMLLLNGTWATTQLMMIIAYVYSCIRLAVKYMISDSRNQVRTFVMGDIVDDSAKPRPPRRSVSVSIIDRFIRTFPLEHPCVPVDTGLQRMANVTDSEGKSSIQCPGKRLVNTSDKRSRVPAIVHTNIARVPCFEASSDDRVERPSGSTFTPDESGDVSNSGRRQTDHDPSVQCKCGLRFCCSIPQAGDSTKSDQPSMDKKGYADKSGLTSARCGRQHVENKYVGKGKRKKVASTTPLASSLGGFDILDNSRQVSFDSINIMKSLGQDSESSDTSGSCSDHVSQYSGESVCISKTAWPEWSQGRLIDTVAWSCNSGDPLDIDDKGDTSDYTEHQCSNGTSGICSNNSRKKRHRSVFTYWKRLVKLKSAQKCFFKKTTYTEDSHQQDNATDTRVPIDKWQKKVQVTIGMVLVVLNMLITPFTFTMLQEAFSDDLVVSRTTKFRLAGIGYLAAALNPVIYANRIPRLRECLTRNWGRLRNAIICCKQRRVVPA